MKPLLLLSLLAIPLVLAQSIARGEEGPTDAGFARNLTAHGKEMTLHVNNAVQKGVTWLRQEQRQDGSWPTGARAVPGTAALPLVALLHSGCALDDECIARGLQRLKTLLLRDPRDAGLLLLALGTPKKDSEIPPDRLSWMKDCADFLLKARVSSGRLLAQSPEEADGIRDAWGIPGRPADPFTTFIAIRGLRSAARCGLRVPEDVWVRVLEHFLETQERVGPPVPRMELAEERRDGLRIWVRSEGPPSHARGWPLTASTPPGVAKPGEPSAPSAGPTGAGVACVAAALSALGIRCPVDLRMFGTKSVRDGIAWLDRNWKIGADPARERETNGFLEPYAVFSAGFLSREKTFNERDGYEEIAKCLIAAQKPDGSWSGPQDAERLESTCWAVLSLLRRTEPGRALD